MDGEVGVDERAEEPGPGGPLVVGRIALGGAALEAAAVVGVLGVEAPEAVRRQEPLFDDLEDTPRRGRR